VTLAGAPVTIGRGTDQDLRISDSKASRAHAVVRPRAKGGWQLEDAGSANGTRVNDHRIPDGRVVPLRDGDRIGIGSTTVRYSEQAGPGAGGPAATQVLP
jgi:pSer/pThr/pTyr-binding forkhead associated (FHA) protein